MCVESIFPLLAEGLTCSSSSSSTNRKEEREKGTARRTVAKCQNAGTWSVCVFEPFFVPSLCRGRETCVKSVDIS